MHSSGLIAAEFSTLSDKTFLSYLIGFDRIDSVIEMWEELQDYKRQDEYDKEEMEDASGRIGGNV